MSYQSPEADSFSTPPSTPGPSARPIRPSLSRRSSRPSLLQIDQGVWPSDVVVEEAYLEASKKHDNAPPLIAHPPEQAMTPRISTNFLSKPAPVPEHQRPIDSPCFLHSHLDKGASLTEWLRSKQNALVGTSEVGVAKSLQNLSARHDLPASPGSVTPASDDDYETDYSASLTTQLAETAISVREMSKQLGRTRVRTNIQTVLVVTKARDNRLIKLTRQLALYLMLRFRPGQKRGLTVYVDHQLRHSRRFNAEGIRREHPELFLPYPRRQTSSISSSSSLSSASGTSDESYLEDSGQLRYWTLNMCSESPHLFDFVVTLGGDGTVLFTSWLFQHIVPPVLPFALGSLGFLTNFDFSDYPAVIDSALDNGIRVNLRMRFTCTVYRAVSHSEAKRRKAVKKKETGEILMKNIEKGGWEALEAGFPAVDATGKCGTKDKEVMCFTTRPAETFEVLNDLVVDRGPSPYVSLLELFGDEHHMTTVQADGLTVATPTGSTAYSLSAGGSLAHPEIPAILITPICPHTLSFRPMLLPDSMELRICVPYNSRSTAWASFDGRGRVELRQGDHIKVTASKYPFPTVCADKQSTDWFHAISRTLKWNERERQKSFVVVEEEGPAKPKRHAKRSGGVSQSKVDRTFVNNEDLDEEDQTSDDDDTFDINDSSAAAPGAPPNNLTAREAFVGQKKALEQAAVSLLLKYERRPRSRSPAHSSEVHSGVDTPGRFACPEPHLVPREARHHFGVERSPPNSSGSERSVPDAQPPRNAHGRIEPRKSVGRGGEDKTPTASIHYHTSRSRLASRRSRSVPPHRAFAVWGNDESDSNPSDSSVDG